MRKSLASLLACFAVLFFIGTANAQITTNSGSGLAPTYPDLASAITALNAATITSPVTITVTAANPQTAPAGGYAITATGTAINTIIITGNNNVITASPTQGVGNLNDAIFKIIGGDWITLSGFNMQENAANVVNVAATNTMTEWGVALLYASATDGAQNNTIQSNTITLNRTYLNTFGIYSSTRHTATAATVAAEVTSAAGSNSNNKVYTNTINNVNYGIVFIGAIAAANMDSGNDIGGSSVLTGNIITNWGGGSALSGYVSLTTSNYCIFDYDQINDNVSFNTITSAALAQGVTTGGFLKNYGGNPTGTITTTINNNTVQVTNNPSIATTGAVIGINNQGLTALLSTATMSMNNNTVQNCVLGGAISTTNGMSCITNLSLPGVMNMNGNTIVNNAITATTATSAIINAISNSGNAGTVNINSNVIRSMSSTATTGQPQGITNSGVVVTALNIIGNALGNTTSGFYSTAIAQSGTLFGISTSAGASTCTTTIQLNDIRGITYGVAATAGQTYITQTGVVAASIIDQNTFTNLNVNISGTVNFISQTYSATATGTKSVTNNSIVTGYTRGGASGTVIGVTDNGSSVQGSTSTCTGNNFSNITLSGTSTFTAINLTDGGAAPVKTVTGNTINNISGGTGTLIGVNVTYINGASTFSNNTITNITGQGTVTGMNFGSTINTGTVVTINNNTINNLVSNTTGGAVTGIICANTSPAINISNNPINTLSSIGASAVTGISITGATNTNVLKNKIYDLSGSNASSTVNGILVSGGAVVTVSNNLVGDLRAPSANAINPVNGLSITAGTTINAYYNSVYLNATSAGAVFGSSAVSVSTTPTVTLRNNIFVNLSTANTTGFTVAYRRASATLTSYSNNSNNNLFYAGTPSATNLIYYDGTNSDQTFPAFKTRMSTRDQASVTENPTFQSTTGSSANFLKFSTSVATQVESGGANIATFTDDNIGTVRQGNPGYSGTGTAPDIGAWELNGIPLDLAGPGIAYTALGNTAAFTDRVLTANISDASGVPTAGALKPRIYYKKNAGAYFSQQGTLTSGTGSSGTWDFPILSADMGGVTTADVISYFVIAQDISGNLNSSPGGATATDVNNVSVPPAAPNTYTILAGISGVKTVGTGGDYATLTAAVNDLNAKVLNGALVLNLTDALYSGSETFPISVNVNGGSSSTNTVTIKPASGNTSCAITGSAVTAPILINGADYIIIDGSNNGSTSRDLTITNTNTGTASAVVWMQTAGADGATNNTIKNSVIVGNSNITTLYGLGSGSSTISLTSAGTSNNSNTYQNNNISKCQFGIFTGGASGTVKNTGTVITQNLMNTASPNNLAVGGVNARFEDGISITENNIGNIDKVGGTVTGTAFGIALGLIPFNTSTVFTGSDVTNALVSKNVINNITNINATGYSAYGIIVNTVTAGTTNILNNSISGISSPSTPSDITIGILLGAGAGSTTNCYYNSVYMTGARGAATTSSLCVGLVADNPVNLKNNILYNSSTSSAAGKSYAIGTIGTTFANLASNYNDLYVSGPAVLGITGAFTGGTERTTLAAWRSATTNDASSLSGDPAFTSASNLVIDGTNVNSWTVNGNGTPIATVSTDILGGARSTAVATGTTDIGAYNVAPSVAPPVATESAAPAPSTTTTYSLNGKTFASLAWGVGATPPTTISLQFYSGTNPPGAGAFPVGNGYWVLTATGGTTYSYDVTFNYDDAQIGTITPEADLRLTKSDNGGTTYTPFTVAGTGPGQYALNTTANTITVFGLTSFSTFAITDQNNPLPVELSSFTSSIDRRNVELNWSTAAEQNNAGFDVERRIAGTDSWSKVGYAAGHGTSNVTNSYKFNERNLPSAKYNYRLKQMDNNGNFKYFELSSEVIIGIPTKFDLSQNYPNPFNPTTKINFDLPFDSKVQIVLFDMTGRQVATILDGTQTAGYQTVSFNASNLASGAYFYQISATGGSQSFVKTMKMMLVK